MAKASYVADAEQGSVVVQGFRKDGEDGTPYVFIGYDVGAVLVPLLELSSESAHIMSEEIRKQAEFANGSAEGE